MKKLLLASVLLFTLNGAARADFSYLTTWPGIHNGDQLKDALMCATQGFFHTPFFNGISGMQFSCSATKYTHGGTKATDYCQAYVPGYGVFNTSAAGDISQRTPTSQWYWSGSFTNSWLSSPGSNWGSMNFEWNQTIRCGAGGVCSIQDVNYFWSYQGAGTCNVSQQGSGTIFATFFTN